MGPVDVVDDDGLPIALGGPKERLVLTTLAIHAGQIVSESRLADALWGEHPPRTAAKTLQSYVSRLRKALASHSGLAIVSMPPGYVLRCDAGQTDVGRLEQLLADARLATAAADHGVAARLLAEAESLWRGPVLGDQAGEPFAVAEAARLEELRTMVVEERVDAELAAGWHGALVAELESLTARYPLRERLWAARMLALYRCGRQGDALRAFQELRSHLGEDLGIEPTPQLFALEQAILLQKPELDMASPAAVAPALPGPVLPSGVVTFLLTDIEGSTALWDRDARAMDVAMRCHDSTITAVVEDNNGVLLKARGEGDSTFSVFWRATDAAAAAIEAQAALAGADLPFELRVRMAIHTGEAFERDGDYFGTAVNRAARVRSVARGGETLVSRSAVEVLVDHVGSEWQLVELGQRRLRDLHRPETIWALVAGATPTKPATTIDSPDASDTSPDAVSTEGVGPENRTRAQPRIPSILERYRGTPFVGRETELDRLLAAQGRATDEAVVAFVSGEPGVGKTRLAAELARHAHANGVTVLAGRCTEDGVVPFEPFTEALRGSGDVFDGLSDEHRGQLARLVPSLGSPAAPIDADSDRWLLFEAVRAALGAAGRGGVVLVLDDLHWADRATLSMLQHVSRHAEGGLFVVVTYREQELSRTAPFGAALADLRRDATVERIALRGLGADETAELVAALHDGDPPADLAARVHAETEGNPFFVEEVVAGDASGSSAIPESVQEAIGRRLSRLSVNANDALRAAAVVGRDFTLQLAAAATGVDDIAVAIPAIEEALAAGIVVESDRPGSYTFSHALLREVLLAELTQTGRAVLHWRIAQALAADPCSEPATVAHHHLAGAAVGSLEDAVAWARRAAETAMDRAAFDDAAAMYGLAEDAVRLLAPNQRALQCSLAVERVTPLRAGARLDEAREAALAGFELACDLDDPVLYARAVEARADAVAVMYRVEDEELEGLLRGAVDRLPVHERAMRSRLLSMLGFMRWFAGHIPQARSAAAEARALADGSGDEFALGQALEIELILTPGPWGPDDLDRSHASQAAYRRHRRRGAWAASGQWALAASFEALYHVSRGAGEESRAIRRRITDEFAPHPTPLADWLAANHDAIDALQCEPMAVADAAVQHEMLVGQRLVVADWTVTWGVHVIGLRREQDRMAEALPLFDPQVAMQPKVLSWRIGRAWAKAWAGLPEEARVDFNVVVEAGFAMNEDMTYSGVLGLLGETASLLGAVEHAATLFDRLERFSGHGLVVGGADTLGAADRILALLAALDGRHDDADLLFASAVEFNDRLRSPRWVAWTKAQWAEVLEAVGNPRARSLAAEAAAIADRYELALVRRVVRDRFGI